MNIFDNNPIVVGRNRYDELLRKEAMLETIEKLHGRMTEYVFRDAVGYLLKPAIIESDEDE